jgi:hypothetical protein
LLTLSISKLPQRKNFHEQGHKRNNAFQQIPCF